MAADPNIAVLTGDPLMTEMRRRFDRGMEWEAQARKRFIQDIKFRHGDSDNMYQWPNAILRDRDVYNRPCLTMNLVRQHNLQIANEALRKEMSAKIMGAGGGATQESANVIKNIIRYIERKSAAQSAYAIARAFQIDGGWGWWRIVTDRTPPSEWVTDADGFNQEIYIQPILDPLSIVDDPDCIQADHSDSKWAFVFDSILKDEVEEAYPWSKNKLGTTPFGVGVSDAWVEKDHVMVCEYFRKVPKADKLLSFVKEGQRTIIRKSKLPPKIAAELLDDDKTQVIDFVDNAVEWKLVVGDQIVDETDWPGRYIPLIRVVGEETAIEGHLDRKGHTRAMKDAQRMYNYNASGQVEFGALQSKSPYVAPAKAIENHQQYWSTANTTPHSVLPYDHVDEQNPDKEIPMPVRQEPPSAAPIYESGMTTAFNQMMMTSGQWQNQMGMMGNERTGRAIEDRMDQGDTATFHFQWNYKNALIFTYKQIIDLIPFIYDTKRVKMIQADDGTDMAVELDPGAQKVYAQEMDHENRVIRRVLNPTVGKYEVAPDVGPDPLTERKETADALTLILTQAPGLTAFIGDLLLASLPFEKAQEAALRLKRMVPPQALGEGPTQTEQQQQQTIAQLQAGLAKVLEEHGRDRVKLVGKDQLRDIDAYKAETDRMKALADMLPTDEAGLRQIIEQLVGDALKTHLEPILKANQEDIGGGASEAAGGEAPPMPGAQKGIGDYSDNWYVRDPTRRGRYLMISPLAQPHKPPQA